MTYGAYLEMTAVKLLLWHML